MANKQLTGLCGEHYVAAYLAGHQLAVAVPRGGAARDDLFVAECKRGRPLRVQVKAARSPYKKYRGRDYCEWATNADIADTHDKSLWFAFVALRNWPHEQAIPEIWFVPSAVVGSRMAQEKVRSWPYYWMYVDESGGYRNEKGMALLKAALAAPCQASDSPST